MENNPIVEYFKSMPSAELEAVVSEVLLIDESGARSGDAVATLAANLRNDFGVSGDVSRSLAENGALKEVARRWLRSKRADAEHTHACIRCDFAYTPADGETENCPNCGHDGSPVEG